LKGKIVKKRIHKESKLKIKIKRMSTKLEGIKNQDYGSNDEIENKLKFDKIFKNQNLKSKHLGHNVKYHQTLN
jgi:hypothetical protein